jgi:hypothetical protein
MMVSIPSVPARRMISELENCVIHCGSLRAVEGPYGVHEAVVDLHLLARTDVELLRDERLCNVPGELRVTLERCDGFERPAFVVIAVYVRAARMENVDPRFYLYSAVAMERRLGHRHYQ